MLRDMNRINPRVTEKMYILKWYMQIVKYRYHHDVKLYKKCIEMKCYSCQHGAMNDIKT